jgi:hypothetical protein
MITVVNYVLFLSDEPPPLHDQDGYAMEESISEHSIPFCGKAIILLSTSHHFYV